MTIHTNSHPRLLEALASLNQIGPGEQIDMEETLKLIVESAIKHESILTALSGTFAPIPKCTQQRG